MTDAITRVREAIAVRDAAFAAIEASKQCTYTDDDLHELTSALIEAAPEMLRAVDEIERIRAANAAFSARNVELQLEIAKLKDQRERLRLMLSFALGFAEKAGMSAEEVRCIEALFKETGE